VYQKETPRKHPQFISISLNYNVCKELWEDALPYLLHQGEIALWAGLQLAA